MKSKGRLRQIVEKAVVEAERSGQKCPEEVESGQKWSEVVRSGQKWSEVKMLDFTFRREYLAHAVAEGLGYGARGELFERAEGGGRALEEESVQPRPYTEHLLELRRVPGKGGGRGRGMVEGEVAAGRRARGGG